MGARLAHTQAQSSPGWGRGWHRAVSSEAASPRWPSQQECPLEQAGWVGGSLAPGWAETPLLPRAPSPALRTLCAEELHLWNSGWTLPSCGRVTSAPVGPPTRLLTSKCVHQVGRAPASWHSVSSLSCEQRVPGARRELGSLWKPRPHGAAPWQTRPGLPAVGLRPHPPCPFSLDDSILGT